MNAKYVDVSSGGLLRNLRSRWRLVGACALVGLALAGVHVLTQGTSYTAESQVLVGQPLTLQTLTTGAPANVDQARLVDYTSRVLESSAISDRVDTKLGTDRGDYSLDVLSANATSVIVLRANAGDADRAQQIANAYAKAYVAWIAGQNGDRVQRAVEYLTEQSKGIAAQLLKLDQKVADAPNPSAAGVALAPQRTALVQQQVELQTLLNQAELAGTVDPSGGAQVVQAAGQGEVSTFGALGQLVLGLLFGLLVGLFIEMGLASVTRRATGPADAQEQREQQERERVLSAAPEAASA